jgi:Ca2+-binding RTX toxin-like protein
MATFTCYVPTNTFRGGFRPDSTFPFGDGSAIELDYPDFYELYGGAFSYPGGIPDGLVYTIRVYNYSNNLTQYWTADGGLYDAGAVYDLARNGSWQDFFQYIFFLNDNIYGSPFRDKLNGYNGQDFIQGGQGNDKLKGGRGGDTFYFVQFDGRDVIKDFSWRSDTLWLDTSLANNAFDVFDAVRTYRKGIILDFGSDEIKIVGLKLSKLDNVDVDFV